VGARLDTGIYLPTKGNIMYNIKKLAIAASAVMLVRDAAGEVQVDESNLDAAGNPAELSITFHSPGTKKYQAAKHAADERHNGRVFNRMQGRSDIKQSAEEKLRERATFLADITISFNNFGDDKGAGRELFLRTYSDPELGHILDDGEKFTGDRGNFKKSSPTSSPSTSDTQPG
jgi:hypothetical protein